MSEPRCPACQAPLRKLPSLKSKCPSCGQFMYMKRGPDESEKRLVSEAEAERIEQMWLDRAVENSFFDLHPFHEVSKQEFDAKLDELRPIIDGKDLHWSAAWELTNEWLAIESDLLNRKMLYFYLARLAQTKGRNFREYLRSGHRQDILLHQEAVKGTGKSSLVKIDTPDHACNACKRNKGRTYTLEQAYELAPLPCHDCTCVGDGFCTCLYTYELKGSRIDAPS